MDHARSPRKAPRGTKARPAGLVLVDAAAARCPQHGVLQLHDAAGTAVQVVQTLRGLLRLQVPEVDPCLGSGGTASHGGTPFLVSKDPG